MPPKAPPKPPASPASPAGPAPAQKQASQNLLEVSSGVMTTMGERIGIYGPGGIGKTELVASLDQLGMRVLFVDLDKGTTGLNVCRAIVDGQLVETFSEIRNVLHNENLLRPFDLVAIDTFSSAEDMIRQFVIETVPHEKAKPINRLEDYGYGKGYSHVFETALLLLQDLDAICRSGKHVILVCHQCAEKVPSAESEDYLEYQPRLQSPPKSGKLRERVFEWCNHFFRIDHDRDVRDGKVVEGDVRTIHTVRTTTAWAKHRSLANGRELPSIIPYPKGSSTLWNYLFGKD